jgi:hypothetical protein
LLGAINICKTFNFFWNWRIFGPSWYVNMQANKHTFTRHQNIHFIFVIYLIVLDEFLGRKQSWNIYTVMNEWKCEILKGTRKWKWNRDIQLREKINELRFGKSFNQNSNFFLRNHLQLLFLFTQIQYSLWILEDKKKKRLKEKGRGWVSAESVEIKIWMWMKWMNIEYWYVCIYNVTENQLTDNWI